MRFATSTVLFLLALPFVAAAPLKNTAAYPHSGFYNGGTEVIPAKRAVEPPAQQPEPYVPPQGVSEASES
ncbi:hypothetical protein EIP91_003440 [Steccherinum ochraceum]|uniref:Uncharacterized protein n=1 Tax=Steccherinum ochraceum TaxID=92696 RepID=A0A4R0RR49_9APHY|nr:hypothetical protein EIP91_003440 [Steccherinum ochraceum]